jgi:adenosylcobyric acid synthase
MAKALMILGTGSDVGKSIVAAAFCRIFKRRGFKVAPFKAQNMSNNSYVTVDGGEIGRAQVVQAEAAGLLPTVHMNPILLKPSSGTGSQVVLRGKVFEQMEAIDYHAYKSRLKEVVLSSYQRLAKEYDIIVMEGAGSCCEMNLKENDLVNLPMAKWANAPCLLVGDIDRGGVFAQLIGSYDLMTPEEQSMTMGFLINKFRGDPRLFESGIKIIEDKTGRPVLGVTPFYQDIHIDSEDSVAVQADKRDVRSVGPNTLNIGILRLPSISNFTDLEPLDREPGVVVNYLTQPKELSGHYDALILPGAKNAMEDALWVQKSGWKRAVRRFAKGGGTILGICGGYQILGERVEDPDGVESKHKEVAGIQLLPVKTRLEGQKIVRKVTGLCPANKKRIRGYEIHMGRTVPIGREGEPFVRIHEPGKKDAWHDGWYTKGGQVAGTYVHGILDASGFRGEFLNRLRRAKGLRERAPRQGRQGRFHQYDRLADHFEAHCRVDHILSVVLGERKIS